MATTNVEIHELASRWRELLSRAAAGEEVIVTDGSVPRARLVPVAPGQPRVPGLHAGSMRISDDFDAPLPDDFWTGTS